MSTEESWRLTPREFDARVAVRERYMRLWLTETRNAPHFTREDRKPWTTEHFGDAQGPAKSDADKLKDQLAMMRAQMELSQLRSNPDMVPAWAKSPYMGPPKVVNG